MLRKAALSKDFEDELGQACESTALRQVAKHFGFAVGTVRAIDLRYLEIWPGERRGFVVRLETRHEPLDVFFGTTSVRCGEAPKRF